MGAPLNAGAGESDHASITFACALVAMGVGIAIDINGGDYSPAAMLALTLTIFFFVLGIALPASPSTKIFIWRTLAYALPTCIAVEATLMLHRAFVDARTSAEVGIALRGISYPITMAAISLLAILALLQSAKLGEYRQPIVCVMAAILFLLGWLYVGQGYTKIDVVEFQETAGVALVHGQNPYAMRFANIYPADSPYYGAGVVDPTGKWLTYGYPYLPWSLLMSLPGTLLGDCRYPGMIAAALTGFLIYGARANRLGAMAAGLFVLTPAGLHVIFYGWTEPILAAGFALVILCACRWPKWFPYALGIYLAGKQYACLSIPAVWLLTDGEGRWKQFWSMMWRAGLVAIGITLPFFLWNPHQFIRAVVLWQFVQPFRPDSPGFLAWSYHVDGGRIPFTWLGIIPTAAAMGVSLWRCPRSPAGFAAAVTFINLCFFAFSKQAQSNYYYFVIATACCAVAAHAQNRPQASSD